MHGYKWPASLHTRLCPPIYLCPLLTCLSEIPGPMCVLRVCYTVRLALRVCVRVYDTQHLDVIRDGIGMAVDMAKARLMYITGVWGIDRTTL